MPTPPLLPLRPPARRPPHLASANAAQNDRQPPELQVHVAQPTRQQLAGPEAVRERRALWLSSSDTQRVSRRVRRQLLLSWSGSAIDCPSFQLYGYDRERFDDAQRHAARRRPARHPPRPNDDTRPNVRRNAG